MCSSLPLICAPEGVVTVSVTIPRRGARMRSSRYSGAYFFAIPARSPVGEWHDAHFPAPLK